MDGLHIEGMAQDEGNPLVGAEVGQPVPGQETFDAHDHIFPVWNTPRIYSTDLNGLICKIECVVHPSRLLIGVYLDSFCLPFDGLLLVKEESMPREAASAPQLPLFVSESSVAQDVLARYEAIRPVLTGERSLRATEPTDRDELLAAVA